MKHLGRGTSCGAFASRDRDEITEINLVEQKLFSVRRADGRSIVIRHVLVETLHKLEECVDARFSCPMMIVRKPALRMVL